MNKTEAVRKAIEALEDAVYEWSLYVEVDTAPSTLSEHLAPRITAIKEALAQPVLKPCRSPYCECTEGKCTHPGCYDARHEVFEFPMAQPEQGHVATTSADHIRNEIGYCKFHTNVPNDTKLYTSPPKRKWVGLTGQEKALIASVSLDVHDAIYRANDKLRELNHD